MGKRAVPIAAGLLVAAVWISLQLSQVQASGDTASAASTVPSVLAGFRSDAWFLPDEPLLGFVEIPAGGFFMGSDPASDPLAFDIEYNANPAADGTVDVAAFYMSRFEVTVAQFAAFVAATGHLSDSLRIQTSPDHPIAHVSWPDALAYARWLDSELRASTVTPEALAALLQEGFEVTLPTEAQWEKAARGEDGRIYPWGNGPGAGFATYAVRRTAPVGSALCQECAYGLSDMAGNVWEWPRSPYQDYPYPESDDRDGLDADALWIMRGGSFGDPERMVRAANRGGADPGARRAFIGFRVALVR